MNGVYTRLLGGRGRSSITIDACLDRPAVFRQKKKAITNEASSATAPTAMPAMTPELSLQMKISKASKKKRTDAPTLLNSYLRSSESPSLRRKRCQRPSRNISRGRHTHPPSATRA